MIAGRMGRAKSNGRVHEFIGRERVRDYIAALNAAKGLYISPGGVADLLRISRQAVYQLIQKGRFEVYVQRDYPGGVARYMEVSLADVEAYMERRRLLAEGCEEE
jgi:hypothetical protein